MKEKNLAYMSLKEIVGLLDRSPSIKTDIINTIKNNIFDIESEILKVIDSSTETIEDNLDEILEFLTNIHSLLSQLAYRYEIDLTKKLYNFLSDFDRIDDDFVKKRLLGEIKKGNYNLEQSIIFPK